MREIELVQRVLAQDGSADCAGGLESRGELGLEAGHLPTQLSPLIHWSGNDGPQLGGRGATGTPVGGSHATAAGAVPCRVGGHEATP